LIELLSGQHLAGAGRSRGLTSGGCPPLVRSVRSPPAGSISARSRVRCRQEPPSQTLSAAEVIRVETRVGIGPAGRGGARGRRAGRPGRASAYLILAQERRFRLGGDGRSWHFGDIARSQIDFAFGGTAVMQRTCVARRRSARSEHDGVRPFRVVEGARGSNLFFARLFGADYAKRMRAIFRLFDSDDHPVGATQMFAAPP
jgi:hypothetical protein